MYTRFYDKIFPTLKVTFKKVFCLSLAEAGSSTSSLLLLLLVMWRLEVVRSCEGGGNKIVSKVEQQQQFQVLLLLLPSSICLLLLWENSRDSIACPLLLFFPFSSFQLWLFYSSSAFSSFFSIICVRRRRVQSRILKFERQGNCWIWKEECLKRVSLILKNAMADFLNNLVDLFGKFSTCGV